MMASSNFMFVAPKATYSANHTGTQVTKGVGGTMLRDPSTPLSPKMLQHASISERADELADEYVQDSNATLVVFEAFNQSFKQTSEKFTTGRERVVTQHLSEHFFSFWEQTFAPPESTTVSAKHENGASQAEPSCRRRRNNNQPVPANGRSLLRPSFTYPVSVSAGPQTAPEISFQQVLESASP
jgi:hypothetical protein